MSTNPIVSILIPIHGESPFLSETLQSIKEVTYEDLDILLIFDRPGRQAREVALDFCLEMKNARFMESNIPGISAALNYGIQSSYGELIARIDADDLMMPARITLQVNEFNEHKDLVLVGTQMRLIDVEGRQLRFTSYPVRNRHIKALMKVRNCIGHPTVMYKKDVVQLLGGYRSEFNGAEDLDLWFRLEHEGQFKTINLPLTEYRISDFQETKRLKVKPGALEEKVILSNWEMRSRNLESSRVLSKFLVKLSSGDYEFLIPVWKVGQIKSIRLFWLAESIFKRSRIKGILILLQGGLYSPSIFLYFIRYFLRIKFNSRRRRWK